MGKFRFLLSFFAVVGFFATGSMAHDEHIVGGRNGWTIPPNATFYQDWAKSQNVVEVSKEDFDACTQNDIKARYFSSPTVIELLEPRSHYYYCGVGMHCEAGQKLSIDVCDRHIRQHG